MRRMATRMEAEDRNVGESNNPREVPCQRHGQELADQVEDRIDPWMMLGRKGVDEEGSEEGNLPPCHLLL